LDGALKMTEKRVRDITEANLKAAAEKAGMVGLDWRISPDFLAEELLQALGLKRFADEYGNQFIDQDIRVFSTAMIEQALDSAVTPLFSLDEIARMKWDGEK
jgi:hypothetical protein